MAGLRRSGCRRPQRRHRGERLHGACFLSTCEPWAWSAATPAPCLCCAGRSVRLLLLLLDGCKGVARSPPVARTSSPLRASLALPVRTRTCTVSHAPPGLPRHQISLPVNSGAMTGTAPDAPPPFPVDDAQAPAAYPTIDPDAPKQPLYPVVDHQAAPEPYPAPPTAEGAQPMQPVASEPPTAVPVQQQAAPVAQGAVPVPVHPTELGEWETGLCVSPPLAPPPALQQLWVVVRDSLPTPTLALHACRSAAPTAKRPATPSAGKCNCEGKHARRPRFAADRSRSPAPRCVPFLPAASPAPLAQWLRRSTTATASSSAACTCALGTRCNWAVASTCACAACTACPHPPPHRSLHALPPCLLAAAGACTRAACRAASPPAPASTCAPTTTGPPSPAATVSSTPAAAPAPVRRRPRRRRCCCPLVAASALHAVCPHRITPLVCSLVPRCSVPGAARLQEVRRLARARVGGHEPHHGAPAPEDGLRAPPASGLGRGCPDGGARQPARLPAGALKELHAHAPEWTPPALCSQLSWLHCRAEKTRNSTKTQDASHAAPGARATFPPALLLIGAPRIVRP